MGDAPQVIKVLVVGSPEVGKTSLLQVYNGLDFDPLYTHTAASDFSVKDVSIMTSSGQRDVSTQIWDIGGRGTMGRSFLRNTNAVVLVVDLTSSSSMDGLDERYERVRSMAGFADDTFPCILVGNKLDGAMEDPSSREITMDDMKKWTKTRRPQATLADAIQCFEASAKTGHNVAKFFETIIAKALERPARLLNTPPPSSTGASSVHGRDNKLPNSVFSAANYTIPRGPPSIVSSGIGGPFDARPASIRSGYDNQRDGPDTDAIESDDENDGDDDDKADTAKVIIAGSSFVGKTYILTRFVGDDKDIQTVYEPTIGADFRIAEMPVRDRMLTLQIWDSAGDLKMMNIARSIYKDADCLVLVYDISSRESFEALETYWENYLQYGQPLEQDEFPALLVGNKCDLNDKRAVPLEEVMDWCAFRRPRKPITYLECSALRSIGIKDIFVFVADAVYDYALRNDDDDSTTETEDSVEGEGSQYTSQSFASKESANQAAIPPESNKNAGISVPETGGGPPRQRVPRTRPDDKDLEHTCWANLKCLGLSL